jgi:hypothetical protein
MEFITKYSASLTLTDGIFETGAYGTVLKTKYSVPHWISYFLIYDLVSVATCPNKNDGVKTAQRWCQGSKNSKYPKPCLG